MAQGDLPLPIRLVPRKDAKIGSLIFGAVFFGFAVFWTLGAAGYFKADFTWADLKTNWFPLFGLPFLAVGLFMMLSAALALLPNSPYFHLQIGADGIVTHAFFTRRFYPWRDLSSFEVREVVKHDDDGRRLLYYAAAMKNEVPPARARGQGTYVRDVRLAADDYVQKKGKPAAAALTEWLNRLRELALDGRLRATDTIPVPDEFRGAARSVSAKPSTVTPQRSQTVVRR